IIYDRISSLQEKKVYRTRNPYSYIYVMDGKVYSTSAYNNREDIAVTNIAGDWYNGVSMDTELAMGGEIRTIKSTLIGAESPVNVLYPYAEFSKLLARAGLTQVGNSLSFLFGNRFLLFAPSNEAVLQGLEDGTIPTDTQNLRNI